MKFPVKVQAQGIRMSLLNTTSKHRGVVLPAQIYPAQQETWSSVWALAASPQSSLLAVIRACAMLQCNTEKAEPPGPSKARGKVQSGAHESWI